MRTALVLVVWLVSSVAVGKPSKDALDALDERRVTATTSVQLAIVSGTTVRDVRALFDPSGRWRLDEVARVGTAVATQRSQIFDGQDHWDVDHRTKTIVRGTPPPLFTAIAAILLQPRAFAAAFSIASTSTGVVLTPTGTSPWTSVEIVVVHGRATRMVFTGSRGTDEVRLFAQSKAEYATPAWFAFDRRSVPSYTLSVATVRVAPNAPQPSPVAPTKTP